MASSADDLSKKKRELLGQLDKLRREASKAERECRLQTASLSNRNGNRETRPDSGRHRRDRGDDEEGKTDNEDPSSLDAEVKKLTTDRETEMKRLSQQLAAIKINVKKFKEVVGKSKQQRRLPPSSAVIEELRSKMVDIEASVSQFKAKQKTVYDDLNRNELQCVNEIASMEKKMIAWEQRQQRPASARGGGSAASTRLFPADVDANIDLPPAVIAFEKFQRQSGGVCGGWNEEDHAIFLRIRSKHKGKTTTPAFMDEVAPLLAPRGVEDIRNHEDWFREHEKLLHAKKTAIEEWRKEKLVKQKEESNSYRETEMEENEKRKQTEVERREKEEKEKQRKEVEVAKWKEAKEAEKMKEMEEKRAKEAEEAKRAEADATRKAKVKAQVEEFSREKEEARRIAEEQRKLKERTERERRRKTAAEEILKFQERDQMTVAQRIVFNQRRVEEEVEKAKRLEKIKENVAVKVDRDPERLIRPTKGMEERRRVKKEEEEEESKRRSSARGVRNCGDHNFNVRQIQHRATPSWRAGV